MYRYSRPRFHCSSGNDLAVGVCDYGKTEFVIVPIKSINNPKKPRRGTMMKTVVTLAVAIALCVGVVFAGAGSKDKLKYQQPLIETGNVQEIPSKPMTQDDWSMTNPLVGTFTTLTGFYDYQSNGGAMQQIRVNPANGNIHVTWMTSFDSTAASLNNSRRVAYAFSTNSGSSWNNFNSLYVPPTRRGGFPSIDLGKGSIAGAPIIADHSVLNSANGNESIIYVDFPEGGGAFGEVSPPTPLGGGDEPIWPYVAGASDGSVVMAASRSTAATAFYSRTADFVSWSPWTQVTQVTQSGGRYPVQANGTGRVGIVYNTNNPVSVTTGGNWFIESTNDGATWGTPTNLYGFRTSGIDTFLAYVHTDFVYNGNNPLFVFSETHNTLDMDQISFWSQATGFRVAVPADTAKYKFDPINQRFHALRLGWPSIGMSGNTIVVVFQAFQAETDSNATHRYNYSDLWFTKSNDGGLTWSPTENITHTPFVDERYPSMSKWNAPGTANMVWTQKSKSGLYAFPGVNVDTVRTWQVYLKKILSDVKPSGEIAAGFALNQNYPNPFNPATKIDYTVAQAARVTIRVYNILGEEVATLLNEELQPGTYQAVFDASRMASGVYYYKMTAGSFTETKKMMLVK
jgi:hypothetical protein